MSKKILIIFLVGILTLSGCARKNDTETVDEDASTTISEIVIDGSDIIEGNVLEIEEEDIDVYADEDITEQQMSQYFSVYGKIVDIREVDSQKIIIVENSYGREQELVIMDYTYFLDNYEPDLGNTITAYFNTEQLEDFSSHLIEVDAIVEKLEGSTLSKLDRFNREMTSIDMELKLDIPENLEIEYAEGVKAKDSLINRHLLVIYENIDINIPAITKPNRVIVLK